MILCKQYTPIVVSNARVSNRKYESLQIQSTTVFPSRSTLGMIETIPQIGKALEKFAPNAILNWYDKRLRDQ